MRTCHIPRFAMVAAVTIAGPVSANVVWRGDFETANLGQWSFLLNPTTGQRQNITVVSTPVVEGLHAAQIVIHPDDLWPNGHNRVELQIVGQHTGEGETTFFSWYFQLPENAQAHDDIGYWESNTSFQQAMAFFVEPNGAATQITFRTTTDGRQRWTAPLTIGEWHQIAMQILWSTDPLKGNVSAWLDGALVVDHVAAMTKPDVNTLFIQVGFHRNASLPPVETIFIDNAIEGTTLADVLAKPAGGDAGPDGSNANGDGGAVVPSDGGSPADAPGPGAGGSGVGAGTGGAGGGGTGVGGKGSGGDPMSGVGGSTLPAVANADAGCGCRALGSARVRSFTPSGWLILGGLIGFLRSARRRWLKPASG